MQGISRHYKIPQDEIDANEEWCRVNGVLLTDAPVFGQYLIRALPDANEVARLRQAFYDRKKIKVSFEIIETPGDNPVDSDK